ncbi:hypothetical protein MBM_02030 [Drepanopeziza brunnea f. sp. 'multigermtubi' MB_m1]|uniref:Uncharacterized protein n=1 Tax=Marssonina brunnea f. sp. multigermtubi (strain MB_m1) TaxID=1072389 RepID=K1XH30_MARBU|nr:uncharacterized protein MBM_02030 [Drepanopeziza brunnea f. sp. 'multigermtubi' MB_m1]EKD20078.1 hypothetical protein MBM_02030 [Drepanopeziza brunnea f. sp. 'multigermtubi' MB_m1]
MSIHRTTQYRYDKSVPIKKAGEPWYGHGNCKIDQEFSKDFNTFIEGDHMGYHMRREWGGLQFPETAQICDPKYCRYTGFGRSNMARDRSDQEATGLVPSRLFSPTTPRQSPPLGGCSHTNPHAHALVPGGGSKLMDPKANVFVPGRGGA